jgi:hypothetical protein
MCHECETLRAISLPCDGPLYLALGLTSGLIGYGVLNLQWRWIAIIFAVGTCIAYAPEFIGLRYVRRRPNDRTT